MLEAPIAAIAAMSREFSGLLAHATSVQAVKTRAAYACRVIIAGREWLLVADGPGPVRAEAAARVALEQGSVAALVSTGYCGALDPALAVGDIFEAETIIGEGDERWDARRAASGRERAQSGTLLSRDRVVVTASEKQALYRSLGARAVEMEAAAVARSAAAAGIPFYCIRVVSDSAADTLPIDFNLYRATSGRFRQGRILGAALARPSSFPGLIKLNAGSKRASRILGDYLVHCNF